MQQPETSKKCPVCRKLIDVDQKKEKQETERRIYLSEEDRRTQRLVRHLGTYKLMKIEFVTMLVGFLKQRNQLRFNFEELTRLVQENFDNIVLMNLSENDEAVIVLLDELSKFEQVDLDYLGLEIRDILVDEKNFENNFSTPVIKGKGVEGENDALVRNLRRKKIDILTHLNRIYRSRKHLNCTAARNYFGYFEKGEQVLRQ